MTSDVSRSWCSSFVGGSELDSMTDLMILGGYSLSQCGRVCVCVLACVVYTSVCVLYVFVFVSVSPRV